MRFAPFEEAELAALATGDRGRRYCDVTIGHSIYPQRQWILPINGSQHIKGGVLSKVGCVSKTEKVDQCLACECDGDLPGPGGST